MLSDRQLKILDYLVREYLDVAEPVSSDLLKKRGSLNVSPATIRNELQELTELGYVMQPHTSAGRVPTEKGYKLFIEITFSEPEAQVPKFIEKEIIEVREQIEKEIHILQHFIQVLENDNLFEILKILDLWNKKTTN